MALVQLDPSSIDEFIVVRCIINTSGWDWHVCRELFDISYADSCSRRVEDHLPTLIP